MPIQYIRDLSTLVDNDKAFADRLAQDPGVVLRELAERSPQPSYITDRWIYRGIVAVLSLVLLSAMTAAMVFSYGERQVPDIIISFGSAALGALAGLLAPNP